MSRHILIERLVAGIRCHARSTHGRPQIALGHRSWPQPARHRGQLDGVNSLGWGGSGGLRMRTASNLRLSDAAFGAVGRCPRHTPRNALVTKTVLVLDLILGAALRRTSGVTYSELVSRGRAIAEEEGNADQSRGDKNVFTTASVLPVLEVHCCQCAIRRSNRFRSSSTPLKRS